MNARRADVDEPLRIEEQAAQQLAAVLAAVDRGELTGPAGVIAQLRGAVTALDAVVQRHQAARHTGPPGGPTV